MSEATAGDPPRGRVRATRQGLAVDAVLAAAEGFRTAQDLHAELRRRGEAIGLTTVYRHLNALAEAGGVDMVRRDDGEAQFRSCAATEHHHHLLCRLCGRSVEIDGPEVEEWAERIAAAAGFTEVRHTVEISGLCAEHSAPAPVARPAAAPRADPRPDPRPAGRRAGQAGPAGG